MKNPFLGLFLLDYCIYRVWQISRWLRKSVESTVNRQLMLRLGACGKGVGFHGRIIIHCPKNVVIGNNVHIGDNAWNRAMADFSLADYTKENYK